MDQDKPATIQEPRTEVINLSVVALDEKMARSTPTNQETLLPRNIKAEYHLDTKQQKT